MKLHPVFSPINQNTRLKKKKVNPHLILRFLRYNMYTGTVGCTIYVRRYLFSIVFKVDTYKLRNYKRYKNNAHFYRNQIYKYLLLDTKIHLELLSLQLSILRIIYGKLLVNIWFYNAENIFACPRLVKMRHLTRYAPTKPEHDG